VSKHSFRKKLKNPGQAYQSVTNSEKKFKRDKGAKIETIIHAMVDLIDEKGYDGFSVNAIPLKARLSIGTIYRYFPNGKEDILKEIMTRNIKSLLKLAEFGEVTEKNFADSWRNLVQSYLVMHRDDKVLGIGMRATSAASPDLAKDLQPIIVSFYKQVANKIKDLSFFQNQSEQELMVKLHLLFSLIGYVRDMHTRVPLFADDNGLVDYLLHLVLYTLGVSEKS
jgi:AcrR family transcriptional regulator